jgi:hypothetical protein
MLLFLQNKAMQDPEIQNILTDPIMRQVHEGHFNLVPMDSYQ